MNRVRKYIGYDKCSKVYQEYAPTICVLDSGISSHVDFDHRIIDYKDFVEQKIAISDVYGHGTHIAGICAGSGKKSAGKYMGISPKSNLVIGKILGNNGDGKIEYLLDGIEWCIQNRRKYNIRVLNISVGMMRQQELSKQEALMQAVDRAWDLGIVTLCAAGNNGPREGSVTIPGTSAKVITVGSAEIYEGKAFPSLYSGRGPTKECVLKPEIYAPGTDVMSCSNRGFYTKKTGTSMSVPVVSGCLALLLARYPDLSPVEVKMKLYMNASGKEVSKTNAWGMIYLPDLL